jgi:4-diphosphocytidyl-2-C-methyl-D-erythritol kinase
MSLNWWPAPAKLNLFLHVVARRADGYHDLQTLFQLIDLCDAVGLGLRADGRIERVEGMAEVPPETDLAVRAARLLQETTGCRLGADIAVRKRIPAGGGLGGGSSDAATVLRVLNRLWGIGLGMDELATLGLRLGSDVPVFLHGSSAWAEGRGEILEPVELPERWYLILHPGVAVSTAAIFQAPELTRNSPLITIRAFFQAGSRNDCEPIVRRRYPEVDAALRWLGARAEARMSGTGACVFSGFDSAEDARRIAAAVPDRWQHWLVRGLNRSPLHTLLAASS